ncbi:hypothetical protein KW842_08640 [Duganella sp. sic0402]|uniref:hypothetical protein n=1 Tax=Duganella sp. sic0402 TaxID=2854786 RepID=UPI001C4621C3|nr:hypothetical protein [Duganella sp. sic0402]MBV7535830.1 hypothetical protein [Duganella sp. sic0402]
METRIAKLEELVEDARQRLAKLEEFATDAKHRLVRLEENLHVFQVDMHKGFADMIKWVVGTAIVLGGSGITVITFVLNNATPKAAPPAPLPPVVIYTQPAPPAQSKM